MVKNYYPADQTHTLQTLLEYKYMCILASNIISEEIIILTKLRTIPMRRQLNLQLITFKTQSLGQMSEEKSRTLELCGQHHEGHGPQRGKDGRQLVNQEVAVPFVTVSVATRTGLNYSLLRK